MLYTLGFCKYLRILPPEGRELTVKFKRHQMENAFIIGYNKDKAGVIHIMTKLKSSKNIVGKLKAITYRNMEGDFYEHKFKRVTKIEPIISPFNDALIIHGPFSITKIGIEDR